MGKSNILRIFYYFWLRIYYKIIYSLSYFRIQQDQQRKKKLSRKHDNDNTFTVTDNDTDGFSTAATDIDDEFFDCSDSENNISDIENRSVY